ncbi:MAG: dynamin family protein [Desulfobacterales bacterium]|nr:MAG: dynamin family protein [Desulfobacterales bacterium]
MFKESKISQRLRKLENHLKQENPILSEVVQNFRELDGISRRLGYFNREESHATRTPWWPLISILGIYSAGKSSFINDYLQYNLQAVGIQAVDDKFSVICYTRDKKERVLPGLALDADPRFPLYKISQAIEEVAKGQGEHIDAYLQLKTCPSEKLRGKILIDSPGFDADDQRTSTLRITDHIIDLSDLVLVFFDARHPETGSMRDTLEHLVKSTVSRRDSNKFLYILNQIDVAANEDNLEEVFAAWQRALAQYGLTAGSSYAIYNEDAAIPFDNEEVRARFESKRESDFTAINSRIEQVGVERAYRIVGMLEQTAQMLKNDVVSRLQRFKEAWRRNVLWLEGVILAVILVAFFTLTIWGGYWEGISLSLPFWDLVTLNDYTFFSTIGVILAVAAYTHFSIRSWAAKKVGAKLLAEVKDPDLHSNYQRAFRKTSRWWRSLFWPNPAGWGRRTADRLEKVLDDSNAYIQKLNDEYTNPSGDDNVETTSSRLQFEGSQRSDVTQVESVTPVQNMTDPVTSEN